MKYSKEELSKKGFSEFEKVQGEETFIMKQEKCFLVYNLNQERFYIQYIGKSGLSRLDIDECFLEFHRSSKKLVIQGSEVLLNEKEPPIDVAIEIFQDFVESQKQRYNLKKIILDGQ